MPGHRLVLVCLLVVGCMVFVPAASALVVHTANGHFLGVAPRQGVSLTSMRGSVAAARAQSLSSGGGLLDYHGGSVLHSSAPYLILWTPSGETIPSNSLSLLERYLHDAAADSGRSSNVFAVGRQFTDSTGFADYRQVFTSAGQVLVDSQPYPSRDTRDCRDVASTYPTCITDAQLQAEISRLVATRSLPTGVGADAPIYFVVTPADVNLCFDASDCADNAFCAYHGSFPAGASDVLYAAIPFFINGASAAQNPKACQHDGNSAVQEPNRDLADVAISYLSHEDNETMTDPLGDGWWDSLSGNESGDNCAFAGGFDPEAGSSPTAFLPALGGDATSGTLFDQVVSGNPYYTQSEWSNGDDSCEMQPTSSGLNAAFSVPSTAAAGSPASFDPSGSFSADGYTSTSWSFGDGAASFSRSAPATASETYSAPGTYQVSLTVIDGHGALSTVSHVVTVHNPASAAFGVTPATPKAGSTATFDGSGSSAPGGSISSYHWTFGDGSTGNGVRPGHAYARAGTDAVTLTVTDSFGGTAMTSRTVTVLGAPTAVITVRSARPVAGVPFSLRGGRSTDVGSTISSYRWRLDRRSTASGASVSHRYRRRGRYRVSLRVVDRSGATSSTARTLVVRSASITHVSGHRAGTLELVRLRIDGPGTLKIGSTKVKVRRARVVVFRLRLSSAQIASARSHHPVTITLRAKFAPRIGEPSKQAIRIKIRR